jgi:hypothetical protein
MREIRRRLSWVGFLEPLSEEELDALVRSASYVRLEEGDVLVVGPEEQAERMLLPVAGQLLNGARACVRDGLAAREQEELVARLEELEAALERNNGKSGGRRWGA